MVAERHSGLDLLHQAVHRFMRQVQVLHQVRGTGWVNTLKLTMAMVISRAYAHASRLIARVGDRVDAGEHIANVGCTGRCTWPTFTLMK